LHLVNYYYEEKEKKKTEEKLRKLSVSDQLGEIHSMIVSLIDLEEEEDKAYQVEKFMTPLKNVKENSRSVSIILKYMAKV
jgi:nanoRNase/pAp phosphatase (c-di-AMP/oligoRNAs hydrolase)